MSLDQLCQITAGNRTGAYHNYCAFNSLVTVESTIGRITKPASELKPGELIAVRDPSYHMEFHDIENLLLTKSHSYQNDKNTVFEQNERKEYVPRLRVMLLEGLLGEEAPQCHAKIMGEEEDFSPVEYDEFVQQIKDKTGITVTHGNVRKWLSGETYTPKDWDNFAKLATINPAFAEIHASKESAEGKTTESGVYFHYKRMLGTMQSARMLLEGKIKLDGKKDQKNDGQNGSEGQIDPRKIHFDYSEPRAAILEEVEDLIEKRILFVPVISVKSISPTNNTQPKHQGKPESPHLERGVIFGKSDDVPARTFNDLYRDYTILSDIFSTTVEKIVQAETFSTCAHKVKTAQKMSTNTVLGTLAAIQMEYILHRTRNDRESSTLGIIAQQLPEVAHYYLERHITIGENAVEYQNSFERLYGSVIERIKTDKCAQYDKFTNEAYQKIISALWTLQDMLPKRLIELMDQTQSALHAYTIADDSRESRKHKKALEETDKRTKHELTVFQHKYSLQPNISSYGLLKRQMSNGGGHLFYSDNTYEEVIAAHETTTRGLAISTEQVETTARKFNYSIYKIKEAEEVLTRYGCDDLKHLARNAENPQIVPPEVLVKQTMNYGQAQQPFYGIMSQKRGLPPGLTFPGL